MKLSRRLCGSLLGMLLIAQLLVFPGAIPLRAAEGEPESYAEGPISVLVLPSYNGLMENTAYIGKLVERPALPAIVEGMVSVFTGGNGLQGLDKTRPMGLVFQLGEEDKDPEPIGFLPVKSLKDFVGSFQDLTNGPVEPDDDGVYALEIGPRPVYLVEKGTWAFAARKPELLKMAPADPLKLTGGLEKDYDIGLRIFVRNIPEKQRKQAIEQLREGMKSGLKRQESEGDEQYAVRRQIAENTLKRMVQFVDETEHVTLGWNLDGKAESSHFDLKVIALPETDLAKQSVQLGEMKSAHTGFLLKDAAIKANLAVKLTDKTEVAQAQAVMDAIRMKTMESIDKGKKLKDEESRANAKKIMGDVLDIFEETIEVGMLDGGVAVNLEPGAMTMAMGGTITDGKKLEDALKQLEEMAKKESDFKGVEWNAETHAGVRLHTFSVPVEDDKAKDVLGDPLEVVLGMGDKSAYLAFGRNPVGTLKNVIDGSKSAGEQAVEPIQAAVAIGKLIKFAAEQDQDPIAKMIAESMKDSDQPDHIKLSLSSIEGGMLYRVELEQGVLTAIGKAINANLRKERFGKGF